MPNRIKIPQKVTPRDSDVEAQLKSILKSSDFKATRMQRNFLKFVVKETLAGNAHQIKGYTVATQVFGRHKNFNQATDPIVSIQANKLRRALEEYYLKDGETDKIHIDIPKGTYVPTFKKRIIHQAVDVGGKRKEDHRIPKTTWPCIYVKPLKNLSNDKEYDYWGIGLAIEIATELDQYPDVRVLTQRSPRKNSQGKRPTTRFVIDGSVRKDDKFIKVNLRLTDMKTRIQIWGDSQRSAIEAANLISYQEEMAKVVAVKVAAENGLIQQASARRSKNQKPRSMSAYEAILLYHQCDLDFTPESFTRALKALEIAMLEEPQCAQVWSMLARLYANIYAQEIDIPVNENLLDLSFEFAEKSISLAPYDQRNRLVMAYIFLYRNEISAAISEANLALKLGENSLFMYEALGHLMTLLGDWDRGPEIIRKAIRLNPYYANFVHYGLWVNWLRQGNYQAAYQETLNLNAPEFFWQQIAKAATLGLLGRIEDAKQAKTKLLKLKPDFSGQGLRLIRHYVKFDDIVERIVKGLRKTGIELY
jgi:adenylate cyclase